MNKKFVTNIIAGFAMLALVSPLYAADNKKEKSDAGQQTSSLQGQSADDLKGKKIVSQSGEEIGEIKDVKMDQQDDKKIRYLTVTRSEREVAAPPEAFRFDKDKDEVRLTMDESKLYDVPKQKKSEEAFQRDLDRHYGISPIMQDTTDPNKSKDQSLPGSGMQSPGSQSGTGAQRTQ